MSVGFAGIKLEDVRGIRAPFLAIGGNNMFSMLYDANFTYDSSMPIYENRPPSYPYTLDYKISHDCMIPPCPNKAYPGVWEIPLVMWNDLKVRQILIFQEESKHLKTQIK